ncbi:hypothetical protein FACS1894142_5180 [Spirochaetia bacterium]|nr:hypothetical protein FACS1894142_5180 [Spirochaetia bacterium]
MYKPPSPPRRFLLPVLFFLVRFGSAFLYAQNIPPSLLATEIQAIEKKAADPASTGAERHDSLVRLARLFSLSGNTEGAAQAWADAAYAIPDNRDDNALLKSALYLIALGELDKAEMSVKAALLTGRDQGVLNTARYLYAHVEAFKTGDIAALNTLLQLPEYTDTKPALYYSLWKISGNDTYKTRLIAEYPGSPEARIANAAGGNAAGGNDTGSASVVSGPPSAMWLLLAGREQIVMESVPNGTTLPQSPSAAVSPEGATGTPDAAILQTGLYSKEENAQGMINRLKAAGFAAAVTQRTVNGTVYWVVYVPPGPDINQTIMQLKNAGIESFPVFQN